MRACVAAQREDAAQIEFLVDRYRLANFLDISEGKFGREDQFFVERIKPGSISDITGILVIAPQSGILGGTAN